MHILRKVVFVLFFCVLCLQYAHSQLFESLFLPEKYLVYQCATPPQIDGSIDEKEWQSASWTEAFVNTEGRDKTPPKFETKVKMLWDKSCLYIAARLYEPHIWAEIKEPEGPIFEENDFEVYIDPNGDAHTYMKLEINAFGTVSDMFLEKPFRDGGEIDLDWNFEGLKKAVKVYGKINKVAKKDSCWTIELAIPWKSMIEYSYSKKTPVDKEQWRINFLRVEWKTYIKDNKYRKERGLDKKTLLPMYWSWSPQNSREMHQPETWGYIQFSTKIAGTEIEDFINNPDEWKIWSLWQIYYLYQTYPLNRAKVEEDFLNLKSKNYASKKEFEHIELGTKKDKFIAKAPNYTETGYWYISRDGRIWFDK